MNKKEKLKKLLEGLNSFDDDVNLAFKSVDEEMNVFTKKLKESIASKTVENANEHFRILQKKFNNLILVIDELKNNLNERENKILSFIKDRILNISNLINSSDDSNKGKIVSIDKEISSLKDNIKEIEGIRENTIKKYNENISVVENRLKDIISKLEKKTDRIDKFENSLKENDKENSNKLKKSFEELEGKIGSLRSELISRTHLGGGGISRKLSLNSTNINTRYNDINFIVSGWTVSNDDTNRVTNITITGGSGFQQPTSGSVDGSNNIFGFATAPNVIVIDRTVVLQKTESNGHANWEGTTLISLIDWVPQFDIYSPN